MNRTLLKETLDTYTRWQVIALLFLGFSAGLPFLLVFSTLNARLADVGVETATIGFFSWLGITYSIKVFWAPIVDRLKLPILDRLLGKRRSWILLAQTGIASGLYLMAHVDATAAPEMMAWCGLLVAFTPPRKMWPLMPIGLKLPNSGSKLHWQLPISSATGWHCWWLVRELCTWQSSGPGRCLTR